MDLSVKDPGLYSALCCSVTFLSPSYRDDALLLRIHPTFLQLPPSLFPSPPCAPKLCVSVSLDKIPPSRQLPRTMPFCLPPPLYIYHPIPPSQILSPYPFPNSHPRLQIFLQTKTHTHNPIKATHPNIEVPWQSQLPPASASSASTC